jgi:DNA-directed RNA polymerase subunit RPC12/RpoP
MTVRGRILFTCLECHNKWMPRRTEWNHRAGIRCPGCGSRAWMESKQSRKYKKLAEGPHRTLGSDHSRRISEGR